MVGWALVPQRKNGDWWKEYHNLKTKIMAEKSCVKNSPKENQSQLGEPALSLKDLSS